MSRDPDVSALERRYRRLLAWYPAEHRRTYGDEMIGVLLAATPQGRRRPRAGDVADMIRGGLRTRLRLGPARSADVCWRDSLAVASAVIPAFLVVCELAYFAYFADVEYKQSGLDVVPRLPYVTGNLVILAIIVAFIVLPPVLAYRGFRPAALAVCLVQILFYNYLTISTFDTKVATIGIAPPFALACLLEAVALAYSPGPRRAKDLLTPKTWLAVALIGLGTPVIWSQVLMPRTASAPRITVMAAVAIAAAVGLGLTIPSRVASRLFLLLAGPVFPAALAIAGVDLFSRSYDLTFVYLPTLAIAAAAATFSVRSRHRGKSPGNFSAAA
jgi:hypothetical protein